MILTLHYQWLRNFFDQNIEINGKLLRHIKYDNIIKDQVTIAYISKGGISLEDSDYLSPYDRKLVIDTLAELKELEIKSNESIVN